VSGVATRAHAAIYNDIIVEVFSVEAVQISGMMHSAAGTENTNGILCSTYVQKFGNRRVEK
jgi:hypothetical protein